jgi:hypothetical protein
MPVIEEHQEMPEILSSRVPRGLAKDRSNRNLAYLKVSSDQAKAVGPVGLKRAEKDLIMRRYNHHRH